MTALEQKRINSTVSATAMAALLCAVSPCTTTSNNYPIMHTPIFSEHLVGSPSLTMSSSLMGKFYVNGSAYNVDLGFVKPKKESLLKSAVALFGEMRYLTEGEQQAYNEALLKDFIITGENFFDLL